MKNSYEPDTILDRPAAKDNGRVYLKWSVLFFKTYGLVLLIVLLSSIFSEKLPQGLADVLQIIGGLAIMIVFLVSPLGLFFSYKIYRRREGSPGTRLVHMTMHMIFCILVVVSIILYISDVSASV